MPRTELTLSKSGKRTAAATTRSFLYLELATPAALTSTDAAGKTTTNTWNARGQLLTTTNPLNETTTYTYNAGVSLVTINPPLSGINDQIKFTYDSKGRVATRTQWGYKRTYSYDDLNRLTRTTFPDATYEEITYDKVDKLPGPPGTGDPVCL
jgi:YD repeat-containing protein